MAMTQNKLKQCGKCCRTISELAFNMVAENKPYLVCKCKSEKVINFVDYSGFNINYVCRGVEQAKLKLKSLKRDGFEFAYIKQVKKNYILVFRGAK